MTLLRESDFDSFLFSSIWFFLQSFFYNISTTTNESSPRVQAHGSRWTVSGYKFQASESVKAGARSEPNHPHNSSLSNNRAHISFVPPAPLSHARHFLHQTRSFIWGNRAHPRAPTQIFCILLSNYSIPSQWKEATQLSTANARSRDKPTRKAGHIPAVLKRAPRIILIVFAAVTRPIHRNSQTSLWLLPFSSHFPSAEWPLRKE